MSSDSFSSVDEVGRVLRNEVLVVLTDMHSHRLDQSIKYTCPIKTDCAIRGNSKSQRGDL